MSFAVRNKRLVGGDGLRFVQPFTGPRALIVISGSDHQHRRRPIQKMFYQTDNRWMIELTEKYFDRVARDLKPGETFSILEFYEQITLHTIVDYVLGVDEREHEQVYVQRDFGTLTPWGRFLRGRQSVLDWISDSLTVPGRDTRSVLTRLVAERDNGNLQISDEDVVWQCIELILFGHDTTACGSAWVAMHLLDHSMIQAKELESSAYREACIKEALRYTPMVIHVTREATEDTSVGNEMIRKGQKVFPCAYLAHHHRDYYDSPGEFDPDRFMDGSSPARHAYFPFGIGARICVGMPYAMEQMQVLLRRSLEHGTLGKASAGVTQPERKFIIMAPENGGLVRYDSLA
jgi:cytochrome P450